MSPRNTAAAASKNDATRTQRRRGPAQAPQKTYNVVEAAEFLEVSVASIRNFNRQGLFPDAHKVQGPTGQAWAIPESDLQQVKAEREAAYEGEPEPAPAQREDRTERTRNQETQRTNLPSTQRALPNHQQSNGQSVGTSYKPDVGAQVAAEADILRRARKVMQAYQQLEEALAEYPTRA